MIIDVDTGKSGTKVTDGTKEFKFETRVTEDAEINPEIDSKNCYNIVYNNVLYKVGDGGGSLNYDISKNTIHHKVCILTAICKVLPSYENKVQLITGTPISLFFTDDKKKLIEDLKGDYQVIFENEVKSFTIDKVVVVPESMGYIYNNYIVCKGKIVPVVDIGGLNTNGCVYKNSLPQKDSIFTFNMGINILMAEIRNKLISITKNNYQDYEIEYVLQNPKDDEKEIVVPIILNHLGNILESMKKASWNVSNTIHFTGGGSLLLKEYIKCIFPDSVFSENPVFDNVRGFCKIGKSILGGK